MWGIAILKVSRSQGQLATTPIARSLKEFLLRRHRFWLPLDLLGVGVDEFGKGPQVPLSMSQSARDIENASCGERVELNVASSSICKSRKLLPPLTRANQILTYFSKLDLVSGFVARRKRRLQTIRRSIADHPQTIGRRLQKTRRRTQTITEERYDMQQNPFESCFTSSWLVVEAYSGWILFYPHSQAEMST